MTNYDQPQELYLCGYERLTEQGFAHPIFVAAEGANAGWTAHADVPGAHDARIASFTECGRGVDLTRLPGAAPLRLARCGDPMLYVFLVNERALVGTANEILDALGHDFDQISKEIPLTALALAQYAGLNEQIFAISAARWWRENFGVRAERGWIANSFLRDTAIREIRRVARGTKNQAEIATLTAGVNVGYGRGEWRLLIPEPLRDRLGWRRLSQAQRQMRPLISLFGDGGNEDIEWGYVTPAAVTSIPPTTRTIRAGSQALLEAEARQKALLDKLRAAQAAGVDAEVLRPIFEQLGHLGLSPAEIGARALDALDTILAALGP